MGWSFRRSINLGPLRINFSKSGVSWSIGWGGLRTGMNTRGKRYSSFSIPGTGVRYQTTHGASKKTANKSSSKSVKKTYKKAS